MTVALGDRSYDVRVGSGVLAQLGPVARARAASASRAFVVADSGVPEPVVHRAHGSLRSAGFAVTGVSITPTEPEKSLATLERVLAHIAAASLGRRDPVVALGGGIVGDLAGFAAATYRRGVPVLQCPTTLLAMVDAAVGGKTGVNLLVPGPHGSPGDLRKNFVGAFHQPVAVLADVGVLDSLPERYFRAGLAECIKHALLSAGFGDADLLAWTDANLDAILARDAAVLTELIARHTAIKARVVAGDEREEPDASAGGRALLNLGHTFGHAIETIPTLSPDGLAHHAPLHHGEAVALGLVAAAHCAVLTAQRSGAAAGPGVFTADDAASLEQLLNRAGLPTKVRGLPPNAQLIAAMMHDKKVLNDRLRLVLPAGPGVCRIADDIPRAAVEAAIDAIRAEQPMG